MTDEALLEPLVKKAKKGDPEALGALIQRTREQLYRFCFYLCRDRALAQDLAQDTYVRALEELSKLKDPSKFMGWLYRIARNLFLDHVKSPRNASAPAADTKDADDSAPDAEFSLHLRRTLQALPPEDRLLLLLVDLEERTYREAGEILGVSEDNVRFRLHHIRKEFINQYEK